jgi:phosphoglycerate dehydrogenase-like enzyme
MSSQPGGDSFNDTFTVAVTADFFDSTGRPKYHDFGLSALAGNPNIRERVFGEHRPKIGSDQIGNAQAVLVLTPAVTAETVSNPVELLAIGRFGVGYDAVDVDACTRADVAVIIAAGSVDRSVAEATIGWMIALSHRMRIKDSLVRDRRWDDRSHYMGSELRDHTLGVIGLGGIARATIGLLSGFGMRQPLAFDPFVEPAAAEKIGVRMVELDELMRQADFVSIHCPLSETTRGLIGKRELDLMKPNAFLINTARGGIVDEESLYRALSEWRIAGAALDCFAKEPVVESIPLAQLDNVILAPHSIAWTNELFRDIGRCVCQALVDLSLHRRPKGVVNPKVFEKPSFQAKWQRRCTAGN